MLCVVFSSYIFIYNEMSISVVPIGRVTTHLFPFQSQIQMKTRRKTLLLVSPVNDYSELKKKMFH